MAPYEEDGGERPNDDRLIKINFEWVKVVLGQIAIAELVLTFLCGCCSSSVSWYISSGCGGKIGFLDFVAWTAFLNILIDLIIHTLGLWERLLWIFRHPAVHFVLCCLAVLGFLIGSSLVASCSKDNGVYNPGAGVAASIFGYICLVLFGVEAYLHFMKYRNMESEGRRQTGSEDAKADVI
ncbi:uncharacterized protein LOC116303820 [Actinia tenebrosa]|uniref:Uncharacterized protein LOC116303820 n=1 Tax=Actinia tenebrosa TaxID=6105 RepID=A0A6P8IST4_ACTTE|nr:uncharacterized protein LOC116303820 [Actinia tenebrosa]